MSMDASIQTQNEPFEHIDDFVKGLIEYAIGPDSPDPEVGKIIAKHLLPRDKHPNAVQRAEEELVELIKREEGI